MTSCARFTGRVALVTGASRGIGLAVARRLVDEGARAVVTARGRDALAEAVAALGGAERAVAVAGNADDPEHQREAVARALEAFGRLDVLVTNVGINPVYGPVLGEVPVAGAAGTGEHGSAADAREGVAGGPPPGGGGALDLAAVRKTFEVNVVAALGWARAAVDAGVTGIVTVASVAGTGHAPGIGVYGASKAALIALTRQLAVELAPSVRVNAVAPAVVTTRFSAALYEGREEEVAAGYPLRRLGRPGDVAAAVAYLAGDDASWLTGQTIVLDGGLTAGSGMG